MSDEKKEIRDDLLKNSKKVADAKPGQQTKSTNDLESLLDDFDDDPLNATGVSRKSLVIFFLIDTSGSMKGTKMGELNTVMEELIPEIRKIGEADTEVKIAVLTFSDQVMWMYSEPIAIENLNGQDLVRQVLRVWVRLLKNCQFVCQETASLILRLCHLHLLCSL